MSAISDVINYHTEFIRVCETGNLYEAAESLFLSESTLLKHMHMLEDKAEHRLFNKCSTRIELTEYGTLYLSYAYRFKSLEKELDTRLAELDARNASVVKLAIARSMNCDHIVNMLSDHFHDRYPEYSLAPTEFSRTVNLHQTFEMGCELAFAVGSSTISDENYECYPWSSSRIVAILPPNHPLAGRQSINLSELAGDKFILFPEGSFLYYYSLHLCRNVGFEPKVDFTIHGTRNLAELVAAGIGVSLSTASDIITIRQHHVAMVEISPTPPTYLNLYRRKDRPLSAAAQAFWDYAIEIHNTHNEDIPYYGPEGAVGNIYFK